MKKSNFKTETFTWDGGFMVDVVTTSDTYEAWIYHKDYGIKELMFGMPKKQQSYEKFIEIVEWNVDDDIFAYMEQHMDGDFDDDDEEVCCPCCGSHEVEVVGKSQF